MAVSDLFGVAIVTIAAFAAAFCAIAVLVYFSQKKTVEPTEIEPRADSGQVNILFRDGRITDLSAPAADLLTDPPGDLTDWTRVNRVFGTRFLDFPAQLPEDMEKDLKAADRTDTARLSVRAGNGTVRLEVLEAFPPTDADIHKRRIAVIRRNRLRDVANRAPLPIWTVTRDGQPDWVNIRYDALAEARGVRDHAVLSTGLPLPRDEKPVSARVHMNGSGDPEEGKWYDVTVLRSGAHWVHYATDATQIVRAEIAQRDFVQTLTKTFALLSTGLAIFDKERRLSLFNPAIIDLTGLSPEFLSAQPTLASFLDALRDARVMPEPKDYIGWREELSDIDNRAADSGFEETWTLLSGQTYRVTGRPFPHGSIAFVFEDITSAIGVSQQLRDFQRRARSAFDTFEEALVIFNPQGTVAMHNGAYDALWELDTRIADSGEAMTLRDCIENWKDGTRPTPVWGEVRDYFGEFGTRSEWEADVVTLSGSTLHCRFVPLAEGATMVGFRAAA
ncbi:MAG: PAS-domain containing protein [Pseudooceanicola sp.]